VFAPLRRFRRGDAPPDHRWLNQVAEQLERPPLEVDASSGLTLSGRVLSLVLPIFVRPARSPSGGIPPFSGGKMGAAEGELYTFAADGAWLPTGATAILRNFASGAVAGDVRILVLKVLGLWLVVWEDCPPPEEPEP
jgi:hypothetical protein